MHHSKTSTLQDEDPYVRKTAAVCVAKLHDISAARVEDQGFLETLGELLCDSNPMVVANAVAAISEILDTNPNAAKQVRVRRVSDSRIKWDVKLLN